MVSWTSSSHQQKELIRRSLQQSWSSLPVMHPKSCGSCVRRLSLSVLICAIEKLLNTPNCALFIVYIKHLLFLCSRLAHVMQCLLCNRSIVLAIRRLVYMQYKMTRSKNIRRINCCCTIYITQDRNKMLIFFFKTVTMTFYSAILCSNTINYMCILCRRKLFPLKTLFTLCITIGVNILCLSFWMRIKL